MIRTHHDSELFWNAEDKSRTRRVAIVLAFVIALITYLGWSSGAARAAVGEREDRNISRSHVIESHHRATHMAARKRTKVAKAERRAPQRERPTRTTEAQVIGGRPAECRLTYKGRLIAYCGCALSVKIFGRVVNSPNLKLASEWRRAFPRTAPAPGMVAARPGHVFQLERHVRGNIWIVYDPNSGGGLTRRHERSIAGYVVVNPHASRFAMAGAQ